MSLMSERRCWPLFLIRGGGMPVVVSGRFLYGVACGRCALLLWPEDVISGTAFDDVAERAGLEPQQCAREQIGQIFALAPTEVAAFQCLLAAGILDGNFGKRFTGLEPRQQGFRLGFGQRTRGGVGAFRHADQNV